MITKGDKILILTIIVLSLFSLFSIKNSLNKVENKRVIIKVDGEEYETIELKRNMPRKEIEVRTDFGYNLVEVDSTGARVLEASCKDKLDVKFGKIENIGEIIVCLPNKLTVEIEGYQENLNVDIISR